MSGIDFSNELIENFKKGNIDAFREIYTELGPMIYKTVRQVIGSEAEAEDITQDIFLKLYENRSRYNFKSKLSTWAYKIAVNNCINIINKNRSIKDKLGDIYLFDRQYKVNNPELNEDSSSELELSLIEKCMMKLSPKLRICMQLIVVENQSYKEVSEILDISEGTVKSRVNRAKLMLEKIYNTEKLKEPDHDT